MKEQIQKHARKHIKGGYYLKVTLGHRGLNCRTSISDSSGYHADFHEGHGTVGEWQWRGTAWERHGNGMGTAWFV
jgi:hypothetical protein